MQYANANLALMAVTSGFIIMYIGYFTPLISIGSSLFAIGAGLIYSLDIDSSSASYLGYQAILGIGQGLAIQVPVIVCQAFSEAADIPAVTAIVLCELFPPSRERSRSFSTLIRL